MATQQTTTAGRVLVAPSVILLFVWMIVPLVMTLYFSTLALQPARSGQRELRRAAELHRVPHRSGFSDRALQHACPRRLGARHQRRRRHSRGVADGSAGLRAERVAADGDRAVLRHTDGQRAGVEEPPDESGFRTIRLDRPIAGVRSDRLVHQLAHAVGDHHRLVGMAAVRQSHPAHRAAVARRGAERGRLARRRRPDFLLRLYRAAAYRARDHRRHPDRDDFPPERVRGNLRDHLRRPRQCDDQHSLPRLQAGAAQLRHRRRRRPAASSPSFSPTSLRSSWCASSAGIWRAERWR